MDKTALVGMIKEVLTSYRPEIEFFNLEPTYGQGATGLFTLSVSTPELTDDNCFLIMSGLMGYLYNHLTVEQMKQIATLRVFNSKEELKRYVTLSTMGTSCDCERVLYIEPELVEVD
ncbi:hypothetical protein [Spirosoma validum]|uniref:Uncharacterized protein n=1 Tax=Spirosoma validum TaxID=2771355 RepID=A0A927B1Q3_9BACT|nr:hypothetical protein [Spirosoma validum]MBD2753764.1 hypothetical protein [Spirosoma validum]